MLIPGLISLVRPQFGIEGAGPTNYGVNAAATRMFLNLISFLPEPVQEKSKSGTQGLKYGTRYNLYKESAKFTAKCNFDYIDCGYGFTGVEGIPVETTVATGVYQHVWESSAYNEDNFQSYTVEFPDGVRTQKVNGFMFDSYKIGTESAKKLTLDFTGYSKAITDNATPSTGQNDVQAIGLTGVPTGGSFILLIDNQPVTIAYNAISSAVQTSIRALAGIWTLATVSGSAGAWVVTNVTGVAVETFSVNYAGLTGGITPTATVTHTTVGGMKTNPSYEVMPTDISIGWATSLAGLDNAPTIPINQFKTSIEVGARHELIWRQNPADVGAAYVKEKKADEQKATETFMIGYTSEVATLIANTRLQGGLYFRVMFTGLQIGATGYNRSIAFDFFCSPMWKTANGAGEGDIRVVEFDLENLFDTSGIFCRRITAINELVSYMAA